MTNLTRKNAWLVAVLLAVLLVSTRCYLLGLSAVCANASMAVFFLGGLYLRKHVAFFGFFLLAVMTDLGTMLWAGLTPNALGISWASLSEPVAYAGLWFGGAWCAVHRKPKLVSFVVGSMLTLAAFWLTNVTFYWLSGYVPAPTFAGWVANFSQWVSLYVGTTMAYIAGALLLQEGVERFYSPRLVHAAN